MQWKRINDCCNSMESKNDTRMENQIEREIKKSNKLISAQFFSGHSFIFPVVVCWLCTMSLGVHNLFIYLFFINQINRTHIVCNGWKYLHFRIQHEITVIAPNMIAASAHQATDFDWHEGDIGRRKKGRKYDTF